MAVSDEQQPQPPQDFSAFEGTRPVNERLRFDADALGAWLASHVDGFAGPLTHRAVRGRPVESDLQADHARAQLCDALEARPGGEAAAVGACDRTRVPRDGCASRHRRSRRENVRAVRGRKRDRPRVLRDGVHRRPRAVGSIAARHDAGRTRRDLRRDESRDRGAAFASMSARSALPTTASRATTSSGRSGAGASSMSPPKPSRSKR